MKLRRDQTEKEMIVELINQPGWKLLEEKAKIIMDNADKQLHIVSKDGFDEAKGFYRGTKLFVDLILKKPMDICNIQGIMKVTGEKL